MCGIVGYIGSAGATGIILDGLKRLEYRGYDSAGVAVVADGVLQVRRSAGRLRNLEAVLRERPLDGPLGIGHTRWATHGRPSEENAHPHTDCTGSIVVVHNGILENYLPIKTALQAAGHTFKSETDTEVLAHLVEQHWAEAGGLAEAVRRALQEVRGAYAVGVVSDRGARCARRGQDGGGRRGRRSRRGRVLRGLRRPRHPGAHARRPGARGRRDGGRDPPRAFG